MADQIVVPSTTQSDPSQPPADAKVTSPSGGVDRVTLNSDPKPPAPKEQPAGDRPSWLPEKFKSPEDMAKAYSELEKKQSSTEKPAPAKTPDPKAPAQTDAQKAVADAGLDFDALTKEYAEKGELSKDTLAKLEAKGIPQATVSAYVEGQKAVAEQRNARLMDTVGGKEGFEAINQWATANLSAEELQAANAALAGSEQQAKLVLEGIKSRYQAAVGTDGSRVTGSTVPQVSGVKAYASNAEIVSAMNDPRYGKDPAYRASVEQRLAATNLFSMRY